MKDAGIGVVRTHKIVFAKQSGQNRSGALELDSGEKLESFTLAYETYGALNSDRTNAILVLHALSGDAHAAGFHEGQDKPGWWDPMIGPGRAIDTDRFFVICSNVIGGCKGSTGPACEDPETGRPYALNFPVITIGDMVRAQARLVEHLGIRKLFGVVGGSMGGMQALEWVATYPERIECVVPIATALKHTPQQIAFNEVGRQAIMADPDWNGGNYYDRAQKPQRGLGVARMIGHITYMSDASMEQKFSRRLKDKDPHFKFTADFEVEGYLQHRGDSFVKRFDANSYLYITKAIDFFDLSGSRLLARRAPEHLKFLVIAFKSDWLYPPHQVEEIVRLLKIHHIDATYCQINATYGHDSFLVEMREQGHLVKHFLEKTFGNR